MIKSINQIQNKISNTTQISLEQNPNIQLKLNARKAYIIVILSSSNFQQNKLIVTQIEFTCKSSSLLRKLYQ